MERSGGTTLGHGDPDPAPGDGRFRRDGHGRHGVAKIFVNDAQLLDGVLYIVGTPGKDSVTVKAAVSQGVNVLQVKAKFLPGGKREFPAAAVTRLQVALGESNDSLKIYPQVLQPALVFGGGGNDKLTAGGGPTTVYGGAGDDKLTGGLGPVMLYGEAGNDSLYGGAQADVLEGGKATIACTARTGTTRCGAAAVWISCGAGTATTNWTAATATTSSKATPGTM